MSKAVKLRNSNFLASTSIVHKRGGGWHYLNSLLDNIYPVGSVFISTIQTNPSEYFGGTWERMYGGYLYLTDGEHSFSSYSGVSTQSHTLTVEQIPAHTHSFIRNDGTSNGILVDTGLKGQWGSPIYQLSSSEYTAQPNKPSIGNTGGGKGHTHNIAYIALIAWKRIG